MKQCGCCKRYIPDELAVTWENNVCMLGELCPLLSKNTGPAWPAGDDSGDDDSDDSVVPKTPLTPTEEVS